MRNGLPQPSKVVLDVVNPPEGRNLKKKYQEPTTPLAAGVMLREQEAYMPRLYRVDKDFDPKSPRYNPAEFFLSASWSRHWSSSECYWKYDLDKDFPDQCYIHCDELDAEDNSFWIALRKDVERRYQGDVFYQYERMDYRRWWNSSATVDYKKEYNRQRHGYWTFYFEEASDQTMFILKHGEILSPKRYRFHPIMGISCADDRYDVDPDEEVPNAWRV